MGRLLFFACITALIYFAEKRRVKFTANQKQLKDTAKPFSKQPLARVVPKAILPNKETSEDIKLSSEQRALFNYLEASNQNIFITGKAGTGKSVLLKYFKEHTKKRVIAAAPTGIAALNIGGQTIHSLFKIKVGINEKVSAAIDEQIKELLCHVDVLVIDEISMVRADIMDAIDQKLRLARNNGSVFGGVQVIMFGDLYQLPPIISDKELHKYFSDKYGGYFFFNAHIWKTSSLDVCELSKIFRQQGKYFRDILNSIRSGHVNTSTLVELNKRARNKIPKHGVITLAATNKVVNEINHQRLNELSTKEYQYFAEVAGGIKTSEFLAEEVLRLKVGAQVMMIRNDKEKRWANGTLAIVESLKTREIKVRINKSVYAVPQTTWAKIKYSYNRDSGKVEEGKISSITQYPLRLAWAVTIHKSQGQTYSSCAVDLKDGVFAHGQAYVALSRCKSINGLYLLSPIMASDISAAPDVINFMKRAKTFKAASLG